MTLHPDLETLRRDLDDLLATEIVPEPPEVADARVALQRAADTVTSSGRTPGSDGDRALLLARMALERAARAVATVRPRAAWKVALGGPSAPGAARVARRRPAARAPRQPDVELDSEIPATHPAKEAIETSVAGAFAGVKGRWKVAILVQENAPWWGIRVEGTSICWTGPIEGPDEQSPDYLAGRVRDAVRLGVMQAALPHRRGRGSGG